MNKITRPLLLLVAAFFTDAALPAVPVVVDDRSSHKAQVALVGSRITAMNSIADAGDAGELSTELLRIDSDDDLDESVREYLLEAGIIAMSRVTPDDQARRILAEYRSRPVTVFVRMHEEHGEAVIPLYDVAAAARFTEQNWDIDQAAALVQAKLASGQWQPVSFRTPPAGLSIERWQAGSVKAFQEAAVQAVSIHKTALLDALKNGESVGQLIMEVAVRTSDPVLFDAVAGHTDAALVLRAIAKTTKHLNRSDATTFLKRCAERPDVASAAILELGSVATDDYATRAWLLQRLGNADDGASAALALSRLSDQAILDDVRNIIEGDHPELHRLRAALVLRLSSLPAASVMRRQLIASTKISEPVRIALQ